MIRIKSDGPPAARIGVSLLALTLLCTMLLAPSGASAAGVPFGKQDVVFACFKAKGKDKGTLRVVPNRKRCKKMRGWRAMSWSATGAAVPGPAGQPGAQGNAGAGGEKGAQGDAGSDGKAGVSGQVEQTLLETVESQSQQIAQLTSQVSALTGELGDLESLVGGLSGDVSGLEGVTSSLCTQGNALAEQADDIMTSIAGIKLSTLLAVVLNIPALPEAVDPLACS